MKHNLMKIVGITIFQSMVFAYVIERIFAEKRGLTVFEMQQLLIFYSIISFFLEIPAGVLADIWKKKYTLALGIFFSFFELFVCIFSDNIFEFGLAYLAAAIGGSLKSGTIDSILFETLRELNRESEYVKIKGRLHFIKYSIGGLSAIVGGFIAQNYSLEMNYWLSLVGSPIAICLVLSLYEPKMTLNKKEMSTASMFYSHLKSGLFYSWYNISLRKILLLSGIVWAILFGELHEMSMLTYTGIGIEIKYFGLVSFGILIVSAFAGLLSPRLEQKWSHGKWLMIPFIGASIAIFLFASSTSWWGIFFLIGTIGILEALTPIFSGMIQKQATDELRVTISSVEPFVYNIVSIVIGGLFGYLAEIYSIHVSFKLLSLILLISIFIRPYSNKSENLQKIHV